MNNNSSEKYDSIAGRPARPTILKSGKLKINFSNRIIKLKNGSIVQGKYDPFSSRITLYPSGRRSIQNAAGTLTHEAKHFLQKAGTKLNPYHKGHEFEAYVWQSKVDPFWRGKNYKEIWDHINKIYTSVPNPPRGWVPNFGGGIK